MEVVLRSAFDNATLIKHGVLGGVGATPREFPFQIGLTYDDRFYCGGSILSAVFIITAAHCVHGLTPGRFKVTAGDLNRLTTEGTEQVRQVSDIIVHPQYKRATLDNDLALVVLGEPLQLNAHVNRVKFLREPYTHSGTWFN